MNKKRPSKEATLAAMRALNPASAAQLRSTIAAEELDAAMGRAVAAGESPSPPVPAGDTAATAFADRHPRFGARTRRTALSGGLAAALIAVALVLSGAFTGADEHPAYAAAAIEVAEVNPRLLVTAAGWKVTDAGEFEADEGETSFSNGSRRLALNWYPARLYASYLHDRAQVSPPQRSTLLGRTATTVDYTRNEYATMLAPQGPVFVAVRGRFASREEYDEVIGTLREVDVDTWLAAMPAGVVGPDSRAETVAAMLRGVPLPPGFDAGGLESEDAVLNHYALAVKVADTVSCAWVERWLAAKKDGDQAGKRKAVDAMSISGQWPLVLQMEREVEGGWAANIHKVAGELERGQLNWGSAGSLVRPDGSGYEMGPAWALTIQCTSHYWRHATQE